MFFQCNAMGRRSKKSLKARFQHINRAKGFGSFIRNSSSSVSSVRNLQALKYCTICATNVGLNVSEDFIDLVGEDIDEDNQSIDGGDNVDEEEDLLLPERAINFWNSTIDWANVDLNFQREGESRRTDSSAQAAGREKERRFNEKTIFDTVSCSIAERPGYRRLHFAGPLDIAFGS